IGFYQLKFSINFSVTPWLEFTFSFEQARLKVHAKGQNSQFLLLGYAEPEHPLSIRTTSTPHSISYLFELPMSPAQLEQLEKLRNGLELTFRLELYGQALGP